MSTLGTDTVPDALGGAGDILLERWQSADRDNPEPVRRRISRFVKARRIDDALSLTPELGIRGRMEEVTSVMETPALDTLGGMSDTESAAFRQNIATGKAMGMGVNPDIVLNNMQGQGYA